MGFDNCYIPNYNQLIEYYNSVDLETFIKRFKKYDSWSGDSDAMNFLENKIKELLLKGEIFRTKLLEYKDMGITKVIIEEPLLNSNNIYTVQTLLRYNSFVTKNIYDIDWLCACHGDPWFLEFYGQLCWCCSGRLEGGLVQ